MAIPELSDEEIVHLLPEVKSGVEEIQEKLFLASLRYVLPVACKFMRHSRVGQKGFALEDIIQKGNIGLLKAVRACKFNSDSNLPWKVYAMAAAKYAIRTAFQELPSTHLIRIPLSMQTQIRKYIRGEINLKKKLGRNPSLEEIAEVLEKSVEVTKDIQSAMRIFYARTVSLHEPVFPSKDGGDKSLIWAEVIPTQDDSVANSEKIIERVRLKWINKHVSDLFRKILTPLEEYILRLSFGFEGKDYDEQEIAEKTGLKSGVIKKIKNDALKKLRARSEIGGWLKYLSEN